MATPTVEQILAANKAIVQEQQLADKLQQEQLMEQAVFDLLNSSRGAGGVAQDIGAQLVQGVVGLGQAAYGLVNLAGGGTLDSMAGLSQKFEQANAAIQNWKTPQTRYAGQQNQRVFEEQGILAGLADAVTNPLVLQDLAFSNAPSVVPGIAVASRAAKVAQGLNAAARSKVIQGAVVRTTGAQIAGSTNVDAINRIREAGGDEDLQQFGGLAAGIGAGVLGAGVTRLFGGATVEAALASRLTGAAGAGIGRGVLGGAAQGTLREGVEEGLQSPIEQAATNLFAPGVAVTERVGQAAALGALGGALLGGPVGALGARSTGPARKDQELRNELSRELDDIDISVGGTLGAAAQTQSAANAAAANAAAEAEISEQRTVAQQAQQADSDRIFAENLANLTAGQAAFTGRARTDSVFGGIEDRVEKVIKSEFTRTGPKDNRVFIQNGVEFTQEEAIAHATNVVEQQLAEEAASATMEQTQSAEAERILREEFQQITDDAGATRYVRNGIELSQEEAISLAMEEALPTAKQRALEAYTRYETQLAEQRGPFEADTVAEAELTAPQTDPEAIAVTAKVEDSIRRAPVKSEFATQVYGQALEEEMGNVLRREFVRTTNTEGEAIYTQADGNVFTEEQAMTYAEALAEKEAVTRAVEAEQYYNDGAKLIQAVSRGDKIPGPVQVEASAAPPSSDGQGKTAVKEMESTVSLEERQKAHMRDLFGVNDTAFTGKAWAVVKNALKGVDVSTGPKFDQAMRNAAKRIGSTAGPLAEGIRIYGNPGTATPVSNLTRHVAAAGGDFVEGAKSFIRGRQDIAGVRGAMAKVRKSGSWRTLTPEQQQDIQETTRQMVAGESTGLYRRRSPEVQADTQTPMDRSEFSRLLEDAQRQRNLDGKAPIVAYDSVQEFRQTTGVEAPTDAAGVYHNGDIVLIRENIYGKDDFAETLLHERAHEGLATMMGSRLNAALNRLWANPALRPRIKAYMETGLNRADAANEVLVDMITNGETLTGDVKSKFKSAFGDFFDTILGLKGLAVSDATVDRTLETLQATLGGHRAYDLRGTIADGDVFALLDTMLEDPGSITASPLFSRASGSLADRSADSVRGFSGVKVLADVNPALSNLSAKSGAVIRGAMKSATEGSTLSKVLDFMPLSQITATFRETLPSLDTVASAVRAKESTSNKVLSEKMTAEVEGQTREVSALEVGKRWDTFDQKQPLRNKLLNEMIQISSVYKLWPQRSMDQQAQVDHTQVPYTAEERQAQFARVQEMWRRIGKQGQDIFWDTQAIYKGTWLRRYEAIQAEREVTTGLSRTDPEFANQRENKLMLSAMGRLKDAPYSPLSRDGDYLVIVKDNTGKTVWFSAHATHAERQGHLKNILAMHPADQGYAVPKLTLRQEFDWDIQGVDAGTVRNLQESAARSVALSMEGATEAEIAQATRAMQKEIVGMYLDSLPAHHFMQYSKERSSVGGFTLNARPGFNKYMVRASRSIAGLEQDGNITRGLLQMDTDISNAATLNAGGGEVSDVTQMQTVANAVRRQISAAQDYEQSALADKLSAASFAMFMWTPSQFALNLSQTPIVAWPRLAARYNAGTRAAGLLTEGLKILSTSKFDLTSPEAAEKFDPRFRQEMTEAMAQLHQSGTLDFTQAHDFSRAGDQERALTGGRKWAVFTKYAVAPLHASEVINRQVTAYAALMLEAEKNAKSSTPLTGQALVDRMTAESARAVVDTHFDPTQSNKPVALQGPWRRVFFQFQQHRINMMAMYGRDINRAFFNKEITLEEKGEARRALAYGVGVQLALLGPVGTILAPVAFALMDAFDDDELLDSRSRFVQSVPTVAAYGMLGSIIDTSRFDVGGILPILGSRHFLPVEPTAQEMLTHYGFGLLGASGGTAKKVAQGWDAFKDGNYAKTGALVLPRGAGDIIKAADQWFRGIRTGSGIVQYEPTILDSIATASGLFTAPIRDLRDRTGAAFDISARAAKRRDRLTKQYAIAVHSGDREAVNEAVTKIKEFSRTNPEYVINAKDMKSVLRRMRVQEGNVQNFGLPVSKVTQQMQQLVKNQ